MVGMDLSTARYADIRPTADGFVVRHDVWLSKQSNGYVADLTGVVG